MASGGSNSGQQPSQQQMQQWLSNFPAAPNAGQPGASPTAATAFAAGANPTAQAQAPWQRIAGGLSSLAPNNPAQLTQQLMNQRAMMPQAPAPRMNPVMGGPAPMSGGAAGTQITPAILNQLLMQRGSPLSRGLMG
jgi:hypothetical protein